MVSKAVYGDLPKNPPAPLEDFIDSAVKTGADVSKGRDWCYDASQALIRSRKSVPRLLAGRLAASRAEKAAVVTTTDHWLDRLTTKVKAHIEDFRAQRDALVAKTMPPARLFDHAFNADQREWLSTGAEFNKLYSVTRGKILHGKRAGDKLTDADMNAIRTQLDHYLSRFDEGDQNAILRSALVSTYMSDDPSDAALWLTGEKTERGQLPGMAQKTIRALREMGVLDEVGVVNGRVIRYPGASISEPTYQRSIAINTVWFNLYCREQAAQGLPITASMSDIPKAEARAAKQRIAELAQTDFRDMQMAIRPTNYTDKKGNTVERLGAFMPDGTLLGMISADSEVMLIEGNDLVLKCALAADGNIRVVGQLVDGFSA